MDALKNAMKAKDQVSMRTLRAIKSAILLFKTSGTGDTLNEDAEIKLIQKMIKQRKESASIFHQQNRADLAVIEEEEITVLNQFLPDQLDEAALESAIQTIILETGASTIKDMGRAVGQAQQKLAGRADGKAIAEMVKKLLSQ